MKYNIATKWIKALKSGKYKQGKNTLHKKIGNKDHYCCLGVLCDVLKIDRNIWANGYTNSLPQEAIDISGIGSREGVYEFQNRNYSLATLNDESKYNFKKIANVIEKHWKEL